MAKKILSILICVCLVLTCMPFAAHSETTEYTNDVLSHYDVDVQETYDKTTNTGTCTITYDVFAESMAKYTETTDITGCDIILLFDQSKSMKSGRTQTIEAANQLVQSLPDTTDGTEHRIAIEGYGRVNNVGYTDNSTNAQRYPSGGSYNTGIYSVDENGVVRFNTTNGRVLKDGETRSSSEPKYMTYTNDGTKDVNPSIDADNNYTCDTPGTLPTFTKNTSNFTYDNIFMTEAQAQTILTDANMEPWDAGAARMDAGLALTKMTYQVQEEYLAANNAEKTRPVFFVLMAGAVPTLHDSSTNTNFCKVGAVEQAVNGLVNAGVLYYALGDYNVLNGSSWDQPEIFEAVMLDIAASAYYYVSISNSTGDERRERLAHMMDIVCTGVENAVITTATKVEISTSIIDKTTTAYDIAELEKIYDFDIDGATCYTNRFESYDADGTPVFSSIKKNNQYVNERDDVEVSKNTDGHLVFSVSALSCIPSYNFYNTTQFPFGLRQTIVITGTRKTGLTLSVATRLDGELYERGSSVRIVDSQDDTNVFYLTETSTGIYTLPDGSGINANDYYIEISDEDGQNYEMVYDANDDPYTISVGDNLFLNWYTVKFYEITEDGTYESYEEGNFDLDGEDAVIYGTKVEDPEDTYYWYSSPTEHSADTMYLFSGANVTTTVTRPLRLYLDHNFVFNYYDQFNYEEPWTVNFYGTLKYDGVYVSPQTDATNYAIYVLKGNAGDIQPTATQVKNDIDTIVYSNTKNTDKVQTNQTTKTGQTFTRVGASYNDQKLYQMNNPVWVVFEVEYKGVTYVSPVKNKNLKTVCKAYYDGTGGTYATTYEAAQDDILGSILDYGTAVADVFSSLDVASKYPDAQPATGLGAPSSDTKYNFASSIGIRNIESWGLKFSANITDESGQAVNVGTLTDCGVVVLSDVNNAKTTPTVDEMISDTNSVKYSYQGNNLSYSANNITGYYVDQIKRMSNMSKDIYVAYYAYDGNNYYYSNVITCNYLDIANSDDGPTSDVSYAIRNLAIAASTYDDAKKNA